MILQVRLQQYISHDHLKIRHTNTPIQISIPSSSIPLVISNSIPTPRLPQPQRIPRRLLLPTDTRPLTLLLLILLLILVPRPYTHRIAESFTALHDAAYERLYQAADGRGDGFETFADGFADGGEGG